MTKDERLHQIGDGQVVGRALTRREMVQRILAGMGAGMAWPPVAASHPIHRFLSEGRNFLSRGCASGVRGLETFIPQCAPE